ncbi:MAG TPA: glycosyltransferase family 2 protein, partial [Isosphaeraceae bacterium]|nr:glycosyltransferase family 2 protein [Isosphaeraceae bacterium]
MGLSVCLLTRDEESKIGRAIASVRGLADQVVVVDTGSKDRTVEVAKEAGAEVYDIAWDDDFSAGRNLALELATGDWILWLNPDEELWPGSEETLAECLDAEDAIGFAVTIRDQMRADRPDDLSETLDLRLFRRRDDLRYVGRLHPAFPEKVLADANARGQRLGVSSLALRRHAYESTLDENKLRWALRLLTRELEDRPEGLGYLIEKADTLLRLNDPAGHDVMGEAAEVVAKNRQAERPESPNVQVLLTYLMRTPPEMIRGPLTAEDAEALVRRWFPNSPVPIWTVAERAFLRKEYTLASNLLEGLIQMGKTGLYDRSRGFDPSILKRH